MSRPSLRAAGVVALITVLCAAVAVNAYLLTRSLRRDTSGAPASPSPSGSATPSAYASATDAPTTAPPVVAAPMPSAAALRRALRPELAAPDLGRRVGVSVVDVTTGRVLIADGAARPGAPASTAKLATAAALLSVRAPTYRITTTVRAEQHGAIVLVGGGDPTLTAAADGHPGAYPDAARISDLARQIRRAHVPVHRIVVDDSMFTGPLVSPAWAPEDVPSSYGAAITPVMSDGGRAGPSEVIRSASPDLAAGHELALALRQPGLRVVRGTATPSARTVATVRSAPVSTLVEQMLQDSDNVIAECLARQVALAEKRPASFVGAAAAIRSVLRRDGVDIGAGMVDGSGLAAGDRLAPQALTGVLRLAAVTGPAALRDVVSALPVAAWSGTLDDRYVSGPTRVGAGLVRAKTGTLTGVSALAGLVHDPDGRLLAFAVLADRVRSTPAAEAALDDVAAELARCRCR